MSAIPAEAVVAYLNAHFRPDAAANLLAAAQPLMAIAWDEGRQSGHDYMIGKQSTNPYRTAE